MNPPGVVKIHIRLYPEAELRQADILLDFDVLIFQRPPEALHLCMIQTPSPSVHAEIDCPQIQAFLQPAHPFMMRFPPQ